jgi:hypothetical protein
MNAQPHLAAGPSLDTVTENLRAPLINAEWVKDKLLPILEAKYGNLDTLLANGWWPSRIERADQLASALCRALTDKNATRMTGSFPEFFEKAVKGEPSDLFCMDLLKQDGEFLVTLLVLLRATESFGAVSSTGERV